MSGPLRKIISVVDKDFLPGASDKSILSIEFQPDGFSFSILDTLKAKYQLLEVFQSEDMDGFFGDPVELLKSVIHQSPYLQNAYKEVILNYYSRHLLLHPEEGFKREDQITLYSSFRKIPQKYKLRIDKLSNLGGYGLYIVHEELLKLLDVSFPGHTLMHTGSAFIENYLGSIMPGNFKPDIILHVRHTNFELLLMEDGGLSFYRLFPYQSFEDILFYLFLVLQNQNKKAQDMDIMVVGEIHPNSINFKQLVSYFNQAGLAERGHHYQYAPGFESIPGHFYYNVLNHLL